MNDYVIITDSTCDLPQKTAEELQIEILPMKYMINEKVYVQGQSDTKEFYKRLRDKELPTTTQINIEEFSNFFSRYLKTGKDILYVSFSSGLSGSYGNSCIAAKELLKKYPEREIKIVDSLCASMGEGLLVYYTALKRKQGASLQEAEEWINNNKLNLCHWFMVDDLHHLKRGGRVSPGCAVVGSMLNIKPILYVNNQGKLCVKEKIRGRRKVMNSMISIMKNSVGDFKNETVFISHGNCEEDVEYLTQEIKNSFATKNVITNYIGPVIGAHTGAGSLALFFLGNSR